MSDGLMEVYRDECRNKALANYFLGLVDHLKNGSTTLLEKGRADMLSEHMGTTLQAYDSRLIKMREGCVVAWARMIHEGTGVFIDDVEASTLLQGLSPLKDKALFDLTIGFRGYELHGNIEALFAETVREHGIVAGLGKDDELRMGHYTIAIDKAALKAIAGTLVIRRSKDERPR